MRVVKIIFLGLLVIIELASCRKVVDLEDNSFIPKPVINCIIKENDQIHVHVSVAFKFNADTIDEIDNAQIKLFINGKYTESLTCVGHGNYISEVIAQSKSQYQLKVNVTGYQEITCKTVIPSPSIITDVQHIAIAGTTKEGMTYPGLKFTIKNDTTVDEYFEVRIRLIFLGAEYLAEIINITDPVLLNEGIPITSFSNLYIYDSLYRMTINYLTGQSSVLNGHEVTTLLPCILEVRSISKEYYLYSRQKYLYDSGRFPEFGVGSNIAFPMYSNVENGYGIFAGFSSVITDTIYPQY